MITATTYDARKHLETLISAGDGATEAELWELSPVRLVWPPGYLDALAVLHFLYSPDDILFIGRHYDVEVAPASTWIRRIRQRKAALPHIMPNPVDGRCHALSSGKLSRRCDSAVFRFRFAVVEFDGMSKFDQFAFWYSVIQQELLNVAALIDSPLCQCE